MKFLLAISCFIFSHTLQTLAQEIPKKPSPAIFVNDYANILNHSETQELEQKLMAYNDSTSTQIVVIIVSSLKGFTPEEYSMAFAEKWQIGQKEESNGLIIFLAMKEKAMRFEVGDGLEYIITDAVSGRILRKQMIPYFKKRQYYQGINAATDEVIFLLSGTFQAKEEGEGFSNWFWWAIIILGAFIAIATLLIIKLQPKI